MMVSKYESHMPRKSRIDAPGALHHIIARVIMGTSYDFMRFIEDCRLYYKNVKSQFRLIRLDLFACHHVVPQ
jgi:hypothetical protein